MKKYIVIYHAPLDAMEETTNTSPEEQAKVMEAWMTWAKKCGDKLVDLGAPLSNGQQMNPDGKSTGSKKNVAGYSVFTGGKHGGSQIFNSGASSSGMEG